MCARNCATTKNNAQSRALHQKHIHDLKEQRVFTRFVDKWQMNKNNQWHVIYWFCRLTISTPSAPALNHPITVSIKRIRELLSAATRTMRLYLPILCSFIGLPVPAIHPAHSASRYSPAFGRLRPYGSPQLYRLYSSLASARRPST